MINKKCASKLDTANYYITISKCFSSHFLVRKKQNSIHATRHKTWLYINFTFLTFTFTKYRVRAFQSTLGQIQGIYKDFSGPALGTSRKIDLQNVISSEEKVTYGKTKRVRMTLMVT